MTNCGWKNLCIKKKIVHTQIWEFKKSLSKEVVDRIIELFGLAKFKVEL